MSEKTDWNSLVTLGNCRLLAIAAFMGTAVLCLLLVWLGPGIHSWLEIAGELASGQKAEMYRILSTNFLAPVFTVFVVFMQVAGWKVNMNETAYKWQAWAAVGLFLLTCIFLIGTLVYAFIFQEWKLPVSPTGHLTPVQFPKGIQPADALLEFFSYFGSWMLSAALAFNVLVGKNPEGEAETKPELKPGASVGSI